MKEYYACLALDVVNSRKMDLRGVEETLLFLRDKLNSMLSYSMLMPFRIRNGDELVGVFYRFSDSYKAIDKISNIVEKKKGLSFYIGCGLGKIDTKIKNNEHISNGSAIINAVEARDTFIKQNNEEATVWNKEWDNKIFYYSEDVPYQAINQLVYTIRMYRNKRSDKQREIIKKVKQQSNQTFEEIGKSLGYKNPKASIHNHLSAANYELVNEMEKSLRELLDAFQELLEKKG
ncbi:hypothetical protein KFZ58_17115 [Virgibacillus sp. NKC19-16]|uniref:SatD family protein n=1 Tax=Virgibacillus salidurans TaxID=2831673 RepID=UPI001F47F7DC|nr:SatD family protein [Virgibacillus sp. NKC19-16]UJL46060.1 hypothetical protein KFZ58_17115 [Virgibacillus sp. NKC19-16]